MCGPVSSAGFAIGEWVSGQASIREEMFIYRLIDLYTHIYIERDGVMYHTLENGKLVMNLCISIYTYDLLDIKRECGLISACQMFSFATARYEERDVERGYEREEGGDSAVA